MRGFASATSHVNYDKANDYYKLLGVDPKDDDKKIKLAYYKLAKKYHPDAQQEKEKAAAEDRFKQINDAYDILKKEATRSQYNTLRS